MNKEIKVSFFNKLNLLTKCFIAAKFIRVHVRSLLTELFRLLTQTSLDELTTITDSIIETFPDEVIPVAVEVANEIVIAYKI